MSLLVWSKNRKMSDRDRWHASVQSGSGTTWVEIRRQFGPSNLLVVVSLGDGYGPPVYPGRERWDNRHLGVNVQVSCNGPAQFRFEQFGELTVAVVEAEAHLRSMVKPGSGGGVG